MSLNVTKMSCIIVTIIVDSCVVLHWCCVPLECCCGTALTSCGRHKWRQCTVVRRRTRHTCYRNSTRCVWWSAPTRGGSTDPRTVRDSSSTSRTSICPSLTSGAPVNSLPSYSRWGTYLVGGSLTINMWGTYLMGVTRHQYVGTYLVRGHSPSICGALTLWVSLTIIMWALTLWGVTHLMGGHSPSICGHLPYGGSLTTVCGALTLWGVTHLNIWGTYLMEGSLTVNM